MDTMMNWRQRLLACCAFTLGGSALEGMWGAALHENGAAPFSSAPSANATGETCCGVDRQPQKRRR
ncbi:hypothetical protein [Mixta sp. Marseille-Q2659]|uniref:hypothetical protein n=1 Tax=Mixta sp. Marseille-Q2659 TaxID=2736607 RepID=UPI0023BA1408|nr:hypothetical protein [Mixta sp. Marseille-Q2659]